jgi:hypothetical protein
VVFKFSLEIVNIINININNINSNIDIINIVVYNIENKEEKMPIAPSSCPVCHSTLSIARLHCDSCGTSLEGDFQLGGWAALSPEQLSFVETFVRCEGKLNRMEKEIGLSYPTLRNRLQEIIRLLGYEPGATDVSEEDRRRVLEDVAAGRMSAQEALQHLQGR